MDELLKKTNCDRCGSKLSFRTLSVMNTDIICMECKDKETHHPRYKEAADKEREEVLKGNRNYQGLFAGKTYPFD